MYGFFLLWVGQLLSSIGSALPAFAFEVHVFQNTGNVSAYALIYVFLLIPGILFSPVAGIIVDTFNKKNILIVTNICMGINSLSIYLLFLKSHVTLENIYLFSTI